MINTKRSVGGGGIDLDIGTVVPLGFFKPTLISKMSTYHVWLIYFATHKYMYLYLYVLLNYQPYRSIWRPTDVQLMWKEALSHHDFI